MRICMDKCMYVVLRYIYMHNVLYIHVDTCLCIHTNKYRCTHIHTATISISFMSQLHEKHMTHTHTCYPCDTCMYEAVRYVYEYMHA